MRFLFVLLLLMSCPVAAAELHVYHVVQLQQGETVNIMARADSDSAGMVVVTTKTTCCDVTAPESLELNPGTDNAFVVKVHAGLDQEPGYYNLLITVGNMTETLGLSIKENDLIQRLPGLSKYKESLQSVVDDYSLEGYPMDEVYPILDDVEIMLAEAGMAVKTDDLDTMHGRLFSVEKKLYYEIPLKISSVRSITGIYRLVWIPVLVLVVGLSLIMLLLRMRS